jgi:hypothetical protein
VGHVRKQLHDREHEALKPADFEERAYEGPLYNQLERGDRRVWTPGQVFEHHVGVDHGLFFQEDWLFQLHGRLSYLPGAAMSRYVWPRRWFGPDQRRRLPNFRLNLFIQAKRPWVGTRRPKHLPKSKLATPFWCFWIDDEQQKVLQQLAAKLRKRALVVYASAAFHKYDDLYRHTRRGTIAANSTFPSAEKLRGHEAWYYSTPGAIGVANPDPTPIEEPSLSERLAAFVREQQPQDAGWRQSLKDLAGGIREALSSEELPETARRSAFFDTVQIIERDTEDLPEAEASAAYMTVLAFCEAYSVDWSVVGDER